MFFFQSYWKKYALAKSLATSYTNCLCLAPPLLWKIPLSIIKSWTLMVSWRMLFTCNLCGVSWPWHAHLGIPLPCWPLLHPRRPGQNTVRVAWWPDIWGCGPAQALEHCQPPSRQHTQEAPQGSGKPAIVRDYNSMLDILLICLCFSSCKTRI